MLYRCAIKTSHSLYTSLPNSHYLGDSHQPLHAVKTLMGTGEDMLVRLLSHFIYSIVFPADTKNLAAGNSAIITDILEFQKQ